MMSGEGGSDCVGDMEWKSKHWLGCGSMYDDAVLHGGYASCRSRLQPHLIFTPVCVNKGMLICIIF